MSSVRPSAVAQSSWPPGHSSLPGGEQPGHEGRLALHSDWMTLPRVDIRMQGIIVLFKKALNV